MPVKGSVVFVSEQGATWDVTNHYPAQLRSKMRVVSEVRADGCMALADTSMSRSVFLQLKIRAVDVYRFEKWGPPTFVEVEYFIDGAGQKFTTGCCVLQYDALPTAATIGKIASPEILDRDFIEPAGQGDFLRLLKVELLGEQALASSAQVVTTHQDGKGGQRRDGAGRGDGGQGRGGAKGSGGTQGRGNGRDKGGKGEGTGGGRAGAKNTRKCDTAGAGAGDECATDSESAATPHEARDTICAISGTIM